VNLRRPQRDVERSVIVRTTPRETDAMARIQPDFSFKRDGRSLPEWLLDLVSEDAPARLAAGEALQAMMYGFPSAHTDLAHIDPDSWGAVADQADRFKNAARAALRSPDFNDYKFVRELILYRIALKEDWRRRMTKAGDEDDASNDLQERLLKRFESADGDPERTEAARRYMRWVCASFARGLKRGQDAYAGAESMSAPGVMASIVFDSLDTALLTDRPGLHAMLADKSMRTDALSALARIGPPAIEFAAVLFEQLDGDQVTHFSDSARALGSVGRDDPNVIDGLLRRLRSGPAAIRSRAAEALFHAGPPLAGRVDVALDLLIGATHSTDFVFSATPALASIGRDSEIAFRRVLELAEPRPPRWRTDENFPDHRYDQVMIERGAAINSLHFFNRFADRVIPVLVGALDTFEEYDPDWSHEGDHERVCAALEPFGPLAAPAVPRLVRFLDEWSVRPEPDRDWPKQVFRLLAMIGPLAAEALPALEQIREAQRDDDASPPSDLDPDDPLDRAIIVLRGRTIVV
jgi:hypothetical protein